MSDGANSFAEVSSDSLVRFAAACDAAKSTAAKLGKTRAVGEYLKTLSGRDVGIAARFLAAQPFAASSGRSLGVGGALVVESIRRVTGVESPDLNKAFREHGEIGEAVSPLWPAAVEGSGLTLLEVQRGFEEIERIGVQETKRALLIEMLQRCTPREAVYLIKIVLGDMRTGVSEGIVEAGIAEAFGVKVAEVRQARLLVGDLDAVAELAAGHRLGEAAFRPFIPLGYMLAQPVATAAEIVETLNGREAVAEDKYDGIRAQLHVARPLEGALRVELFSRGSGAVTESFPDIVERVRGAVGKSEGTESFVLDGEIIPMKVSSTGEQIFLPFSILQKRLGRKKLTPKQMRENPCVFLAFDCLWRNETLLLSEPLRKRRAELDALAGSFAKGELPFVIGPHEIISTGEALEGAFAAARLRRNEGLVIKQLESAYTPGRRGDAWLKLKSHLPTLDVVVVGAERGHGKRRNVLSDVTFAVRDVEDATRLHTIGKAYSGLTDVEIAALTERFIAETVEERGRYRVLRPSLVLEVAFDQITKSDRHNGGYAMRFPRIVRIREDKTPGEADTLDRVKEIYRSPDNLALGAEGEKLAEEASGDADQLRLF